MLKLLTLATVQILSVHPGKRYHDTCISEVRGVR
jgi:hypothetical protein